MEATAKYTVTQTPKPKYSTYTLTLPEWRAILRIRQLFDSGCDIIIIEKRNGRPKIRPVGKPEG